jgi:hypothetical protein
MRSVNFALKRSVGIAVDPAVAPDGQRRFVPKCEQLEARSLPSMFAVTTKLDVVDSADSRRSLREAITLANTTPGKDSIVLPVGSFRIERNGAAENDNSTGDFDLTDSVVIRGAGAGLTVING